MQGTRNIILGLIFMAAGGGLLMAFDFGGMLKYGVWGLIAVGAVMIASSLYQFASPGLAEVARAWHDTAMKSAPGSSRAATARPTSESEAVMAARGGIPAGPGQASPRREGRSWSRPRPKLGSRPSPVPCVLRKIRRAEPARVAAVECGG